MREQLPPEILRLLASYGPVRLTCGEGQGALSVRCHLAPFEDTLILFVDPEAPALRQLLESPRAQVGLTVEKENISLIMHGRAVQGLSVMSNPRRSELLHWVPEGVDPRRVLAVSFWAESLSYRKGDETIEGSTPLGRARREASKVWLDQCFTGIVPAVVFSMVCMWLWVAYAGSGDFVWQFYGLLLSCAFLVSLQVGTHLLYRAGCFRRVLLGRCLPGSSPILADGLLSYRSCLRAGWALLILALGLGFGVYAIDSVLVGVAMAASLLWILWPLWVVHLLQQTPEKVEHEGRTRR